MRFLRFLRFSPLLTVPMIAACGSDSDDDTGAADSSAASSSSSGGETEPDSESGGSSGSTTGGVVDGTDGSSGGSSTGPTDADSSSGSDGSSGGGEPTAECIEYCAEFLPNCQEIAGVMTYVDEADCLSACAPFSHAGTPGGFVGDSVQCRIAHLTFDPNPGPGYYELHCFHAQAVPASQCVGPPQ